MAAAAASRTKAHVFDHQKLGVWLFGAGEAAVLTLLKSRFTWWPLHPVAVAFPERRYAFCLFLVWVAKTTTLKLGGVQLYRKSLPFWYGAICGYLAGIAISSLIDAVRVTIKAGIAEPKAGSMSAA